MGLLLFLYISLEFLVLFWSPNWIGRCFWNTLVWWNTVAWIYILCMNSLLSSCCTCLMMRSVSRCVSDSRSLFPCIHNTGAHVKFCERTITRFQSASIWWSSNFHWSLQVPGGEAQVRSSSFLCPFSFRKVSGCSFTVFGQGRTKVSGKLWDFSRLIGAGLADVRRLRSTHSLNALIRRPPCSRTEARILVFGFRRMGVRWLLPSWAQEFALHTRNQL